VSNKGCRFRTMHWPDDDCTTSRHKVVVVDGIEGFYSEFVEVCSGCDGVGCKECGYHGKRRGGCWTPFELRDVTAREVVAGTRCALCGVSVGHKANRTIQREAMRLHRSSSCVPNQELRADYRRRIAKRRELLRSEL